MTTYKEVKRRALRNPQIKKEYDKLTPKYKKIQQEIRQQIKIQLLIIFAWSLVISALITFLVPIFANDNKLIVFASLFGISMLAGNSNLIADKILQLFIRGAK